MTTYTFSQTSGTDLTTFGWTVLLGDGAWTTNSGLVRKLASTAAFNVIVEGPVGSTTQSITADFTAPGSTQGIGVFLSVNAGGGLDGYRMWATNSTTMRVSRYNNGVATTFTAATTIPAATALKLEAVVGAGKVTINVYQAGSLVYTYDDVTTYRLTSGKNGLISATAAVGSTLDNVDTFSAAGTALGELSLSDYLIYPGDAIGTAIGTISGQTSGSTLALQTNFGGRVTLSGATLNTNSAGIVFDPDMAPSVTVLETLAGAVNSPKATMFPLQVADVYVAPASAPALAYPGAAWDGTVGSGGTPAANAASVSGRGKPGCWLLSDSELAVVTPDANGEILVFAVDYGGIRRVELFFEGRTIIETKTRKRSIVGTDGVSRVVWCYVFNTNYAGWPRDGSAQFYVDAVPNYTTHDTRRIGPVVMHRKAVEYDALYTVNTSAPAVGNNYLTIPAAIGAANAAAVFPARIRVLSTGNFDISADPTTLRSVSLDGTSALKKPAWIEVVNDSGGIAQLVGSGDLNSVSIKTNGLSFRGFKLNRESFANIDCHAQTVSWAAVYTRFQNCWFKGTTRNYLAGDGAPLGFTVKAAASSPETRNRLIISECLLEDCSTGIGSFRSRFLTIRRSAGDSTSNTIFSYGLLVDDVNISQLRTYFNYGTIQGPAGATWQKTGYNTDNNPAGQTYDDSEGYNGTTNGVLVLRVSGTQVAAIPLNQSVAAVVAAVNAVSGWSYSRASANDPGLNPTFITYNDVGGRGATAQIACASPSTVYAGVDIHCDAIAQHSSLGTPGENIGHVNPTAINLGDEVQGFHISKRDLRDFFMVNPTVSHTSLGQFTANANFGTGLGTTSWLNCHLWHPTIVEQDLSMDESTTAPVSGGTGVRNGLSFNPQSTLAAVADAGFIFSRMIARLAGTKPGGQFKSLTVEPVLANLFVPGGFTPNPAGPLVLQSSYPLVPFDRAGNQRANRSALGAVAATTEWAGSGIGTVLTGVAHIGRVTISSISWITRRRK